MTGNPSEDFHLQAFELHHGRILNYAWRLTGCWDEAEDVAAQCFLALARMAATGDRPAQIQPWLYRCAFNTVVSLHRKATVHRMALTNLCQKSVRRC
jgi:DNA-directed RNA polymerase specialized sigma24 family protein